MFHLEVDDYRRISQICGFVHASDDRSCTSEDSGFRVSFKTTDPLGSPPREDSFISFDGRKFEIYSRSFKPKGKDKVFVAKRGSKIRSELIYPSTINQVLDILETSGLDVKKVRIFLSGFGLQTDK